MLEAPQDLARRAQPSRNATGPADASYGDGSAEGAFDVSTAQLRGAFDAAGRPLEPQQFGADLHSGRLPAAQAGQAGADAAPITDNGMAGAAGPSPAAARDAIEAAGAQQPDAQSSAAGEATGDTSPGGGPQPFASADLGSWPLQGDASSHRLQGGDAESHQLGGDAVGSHSLVGNVSGHQLQGSSNGSHQLHGSVGSHQLNNDAGNAVAGPSVVNEADSAQQQPERDGMQEDQPSDAQRAGADPQTSRPASTDAQPLLGGRSVDGTAQAAGQPTAESQPGASTTARGPAATDGGADAMMHSSHAAAVEAGQLPQAPLGLTRTVSLSEGMAGACNDLNRWYTTRLRPHLLPHMSDVVNPSSFNMGAPAIAG